MPTGNSGQGHKDQGRRNGGSDRGVREKLENVGQRVQEGAEQMGQRLHENFDSAREEMAARYRHAEGMMARNPAPSVLIGFGIGFGVGLVLTTLMTRPEESWAERHLPDRLRRAPDALQHLADSLRDLPDAIARRMPTSISHRS